MSNATDVFRACARDQARTRRREPFASLTLALLAPMVVNKFFFHPFLAAWAP
jgi:hypothetical protein